MNGEHIFKVLLNEEQTAYIYQRAKDEGNISCSQVIAGSEIDEFCIAVTKMRLGGTV